jgi:hypothetical protein
MDIFLQQMINGLVLGSMYALVALGYTMVYGIVNLINFAHGEVLMVGALTSWSVTVWLGPLGMPGWLLLLIALLCAVVVCSVLNFTIEKIAYRPLRNAPRLAPLITAMGMSLLLQTLAMIIWKPNYKSYPTLLPRDPIFIGGAVTNFTQITILVVTAMTLGGLMWLVNKTKLGPRDARHRREPARRGADGRASRQRHLRHLRDRRRAGRAGRRDVGVQLRHGAAHDGLPAGPEGLHGGRLRRHRQPGRRDGGRHPAGRHRVARLGLHRRRSPAACWAPTTRTSSPSSC